MDGNFYRYEEQKTANQKMFEAYTAMVSKRFGTEDYCTTMDNDRVRMFEKLNQCIPFLPAEMRRQGWKRIA